MADLERNLVLIADANEPMRRAFRELLDRDPQTQGLELKEAISADEALDSLREFQNRLLLVISDGTFSVHLNAPNEGLSKVIPAAEYADIPNIAYISAILDDVKRSTLEASGVYVFEKPMFWFGRDTEDFTELMTEWLHDVVAGVGFEPTTSGL